MSALKVTEPISANEYLEYYELRWQLLRAPWQQPRGSEKDEYDPSAFHRVIYDKDHKPVAIGRLHIVTNKIAQIRYMAVVPAMQGRGLGSSILQALERIAQEQLISSLQLNARESAAGFYSKHGYRVTGKAATLFNAIGHFRMEKQIRP